MVVQKVLDGLIDKKVEKILKLFFENKTELFHINSVSKRSGVPLATAFRIIKKLADLEIITAVEVGKFKIYKLNVDEKTELLARLLSNLKFP